MDRRNHRGATLIELLVSIAVYSFLTLGLLALTRNATDSWRAVDARDAVQSQLRVFERDITAELKRASLSSIVFYHQSYQHAICFKSAMNDINNNSKPTGPVGDPLTFWANPAQAWPNNVTWQRYTMYYITRPSAAQHQHDYGYTCAGYNSTNPSGGGGGNPVDNICPHKWLIRKDLLLAANITKNTDVKKYIEPIGSEPDLLNGSQNLYGELTGGNHMQDIARIRIIGREVLSLNFSTLDADGNSVALQANGQINNGPSGAHAQLSYSELQPIAANKINAAYPVTTISYDAKAMKLLEAMQMISLGKTGTDYSKSAFTIQLDDRVSPENP
jgi:type II secretory pathway pseudopilin PulG